MQNNGWLLDIAWFTLCFNLAVPAIYVLHNRLSHIRSPYSEGNLCQGNICHERYTSHFFYLNKVLEMDSKHIDALIFKGQSLYGLGNHTGAKYYFDSAFELEPSNKLLKRIYNNSTKEQINSNSQNNLIFITLSIIR